MAKKGTPEYNLWLQKYRQARLVVKPAPAVTLAHLPSLNRFVRAQGGHLVAREHFEKTLKLFNNKPAFVYSEDGPIPTERQFFEALPLMEQSVVYFKDTDGKIPGHQPVPNVLIYWSMLTDKGKRISLCFATVLEDPSSKEEAEQKLEATCLDTFIDIFCPSACNDWDVVALVPLTLHQDFTDFKLLSNG